MSRIGKKPIIIPQGVDFRMEGQKLFVKGPKGELQMEAHPWAILKYADGQVEVAIGNEDNKKQRGVWGLTRALIFNMVEGVTKGFEKKLELNGVGFKVALVGSQLQFALGFSHPVIVDIPAGLSVTIEKNVISISGIDKQLVGQFAANVRELKKPEPYKGKGIKYIDEVIIRKQGKTVKSSK